MELTEMTKIYLELGILGLCGVLIAAIAWFSFRKSNKDSDNKDKRIDRDKDNLDKRFDKMLETMQTQNQLFLDQQTKSIQILTDTLIKNITHHVPTPEESAKLTEVSEEVNTVLQQILINTGASRANVVQYHNGGHSLNQQSFQRMSMTNEQVQIGVKPFISDFKEQFRTVISYITKQLNDEGYCYIDDIENVKELDPGTYEFLKARDIHAKYCLAIHNKSGNVVGFIGVEYIDKKNAQHNLIDKVLREKQSLIEFLLSK